ncbi:MAG: MATE family efflux transporter [Deltaproteobacteria bacterium]|nr:MATE family efflux transporter [Deltaproteobacteria bacterium]MBN2670917.1 MATE family efflux transporter [Deltaproteobacteria bacterium]
MKNQPSSDRLERFVENPRKAMWIIAAPMMAGFTVHAMYTVVDSVFIGMLGAEALAAAGYIGALFFVAIALTSGLSTGITACVAQAFGARDHERMSHLASNGLSLALSLALFFTTAGVLLGPQLVGLLGAEGKSAEFAWDYMLPLWLGMPLFFFSTAIRSVINGEGDAKTPMIILAASTMLNLALDPIFIFLFDWGIRGAALATLAAHSFALLALIYVAFIRKRITSRFLVSRMPFSAAFLRPILSIGLPAAAGQLVMAVGMILVNKLLAHFGQMAVAGYVAGNRADMIVTLPLLGIASAAMTLIAMFSGANRPDLVKSTTLYAYRWALIFAVAFGISIFLLSDVVVKLFVKEDAAFQIGRQYLGYAVFAYPLMAMGMTSGRILQGLGYGWPSLVITTVRVVFIGAAGAYTAVYLFDGGITSVWISFIAGGFGSLFLALFWIRKFLWKNIQQTGKTP